MKFGTYFVTSFTTRNSLFLIVSPLSALTATGTSWMLSLRRRAVTVTVPRFVSRTALPWFTRAAFGAAAAASSAPGCAGFASGAAVTAPSSAHAGNDTVPPVSSPPSAVTISFFLNIDESSCLIG